MVSRMRWSVSLGVAVVAAVWWGLDMALIQSATEPAEVASNNTYWARDVRLTMIALTLAAFVWAVAGDRRRGLLGLTGAFAWIGADVALDRAGVAGTGAAVGLSAAAVAGVVAAWFFGARGETRPTRDGLVLAGAVTATLAGLMGAVESPTDTEASLVVSGALAGLLGTAVALGCAWTLAPERARVVYGTAAAGVVLVAAIRSSSPGQATLPLGMLLATMLLTVLVVRATAAEGVGAWIQAAVCTFVALLCLGTLAVMIGFVVQVGDPLTALAGNPPVNAADEDILLTAVAVAVGLGVGGLIAGVSKVAAEPADTPA